MLVLALVVAARALRVEQCDTDTGGTRAEAVDLLPFFPLRGSADMESYNAAAMQVAKETKRAVITSMFTSGGSVVDPEHQGAAKTWALLGIPLIFYRTAVGADIYPKMEALQEIGVTHLILEDHESSASFYIPALNKEIQKSASPMKLGFLTCNVGQLTGARRAYLGTFWTKIFSTDGPIKVKTAVFSGEKKRYGTGGPGIYGPKKVDTFVEKEITDFFEIPLEWHKEEDEDED